MGHLSELLVPGFGRPVLCRGRMPRARWMVVYVQDEYGKFRQPKFECGCCAMSVFIVYDVTGDVRQNLNVFNLYRNPVLDNRIFNCLLTSVAAVHAEDSRASFLFVCDLNGNHQKWLSSRNTNRHGVAAFDFATVWLRLVGCRPHPCTWWNT